MPAPDLFGISTDVWRRDCDEEDYLQVPPALVVEVLSHANDPGRVEQKLTLYLRDGVREIWLIEPKEQTVERVTTRKRVKIKDCEMAGTTRRQHFAGRHFSEELTLLFGQSV